MAWHGTAEAAAATKKEAPALVRENSFFMGCLAATRV
jgi:hypothetical protein